jgi:hypothetical protein
VCGRSVPVRRDGELRQHRAAKAAELGWCPGSGQASEPSVAPAPPAAVDPLVDEDGVEHFQRTRRSAVGKTLTRRRLGQLAPLGPTTLRIGLVRIDGGTQSRAAISQAVCDEYAEYYRPDSSDRMPPILVFYDGAHYWLADGFHRLHGAIRAGRTEIIAQIRQGTQRDAILASCRANNAHGLRRTDDDKRRAVQRLLEDEEWSRWSDRAIAEACRVSPNFVGKVRATAHEDSRPPANAESRIGRDGREYSVPSRPEPQARQDQRPVDFPSTFPERRPESEGNSEEFPGNSQEPVRSRVSALLAGVELGAPAPATALPNDQRAPNDGYWTPLPWARACVRWLDEHDLIRADMPDGSPGFKPGNGAKSAIEPAVGGGNWVTALREVKPDWTVDRFDIDPTVPGLELDRRETEDAIPRSWLELLDRPHVAKPRRWVWDLCLGNPPYRDAPDGDLLRFLEVSLGRSWTCAFLLRETYTGTADRLPWWTEKHRPAWIVKTVGTGENSSRPKWEGPGRRDTSDSCDTVLVVWTQGVVLKTGKPIKTTETRFDWLEVPG